MKHDYNIFTKQELASFLKKYEKDFRWIYSPYDTILNEKMDAVMKKIDENINQGEALSKEYEKTKDGFKYLIESKKNHEKFARLEKEYEHLEKMRFPKEAEK